MTGLSDHDPAETRCNGRCHEAGERGVYLDLNCPRHFTGPVRAWLDDEDEADD